VPSHARQGLYQQIKNTPANPPLAYGKGRARFVGIGWSARFTAPVVPSHARQGLYQQIKNTPPNPPLAYGKGRARFVGIGQWKLDAQASPERMHRWLRG